MAAGFDEWLNLPTKITFHKTEECVILNVELDSVFDSTQQRRIVVWCNQLHRTGGK
jgi:hypothetical protein